MATKGRVLLVDDDQMVARFFCSFLQLCEFDADYFPDASSALAYFKENPDAYIALITDLYLERVSGLELAKEVKAINPNIPVFLCSGTDEEQIRELVDTSDCIDHILCKPVDMDELEALLNTYATAATVSEDIAPA